MRVFLDGIRQRVVDGRGIPHGRRLNVVLTGELDLCRFLASGWSELNSAGHYVLGGFERDRFDVFARRYLSLVGKCVKSTDAGGLAKLFERTGASTYFLRLILWALFDFHSGHGGKVSGPRIALDALTDDDVRTGPKHSSAIASSPTKREPALTGLTT
jgi:hypothetical protein